MRYTPSLPAHLITMKNLYPKKKKKKKTLSFGEIGQKLALCFIADRKINS